MEPKCYCVQANAVALFAVVKFELDSRALQTWFEKFVHP